MTDEIFISGLIFLFSALLYWGFKVLPGEDWQILAVVPQSKNDNEQWQGMNLTYYGVFNANAYVFGVAIAIVMLRAIAIPMTSIVIVAILLLSLCIPASKLVARIVEKKQNTFTVGGASFVGIVSAPWIILLTNAIFGNEYQLPVAATLATFSIAYAIGEGMGRLACISFGCCYGKALDQCSPLLQKLFHQFNFVFYGKTRKVVYAHHLEGQKVLPIQAVTAILYIASGIIGVYMFLKGMPTLALILTLTITQLWRAISELFRADYRGEGKLSAYQVMALVCVPYIILIMIFLPATEVVATDINQGIRQLWNPWMIISLELFWLMTFLYTGRSMVTNATVSLHVRGDCI